MSIWRRWRKEPGTHQRNRRSGRSDEPSDGLHQGDARVEWEIGGHEVPSPETIAPTPKNRNGLAPREQAIQRHGRGMHQHRRLPNHRIGHPQVKSADYADKNVPAPSADAPGTSSVHPRSNATPVGISSIEMPPSYFPASDESPATPPASDAGAWEPSDHADLRDSFRGAGAEARVRSVRQELELALDTWWSEQKLLPPALLRNGLLVLEAGHRLDEAYLSLLLRSALRLRRGMLTALRHQTDPDRAAYLLKEALLYEPAPLSTETLWWLRREDPESEDWVSLLHYDLEQDAQMLAGERQQLALAAMRQLESDDLLVEDSDAVNGPRLRITATPQLWSVGRALIIALLLLVLLATAAWVRHRSRVDDVIFIPAGTYIVSNENNGARDVTVAALAMDRTEVTNRSYRICYEQGQCALPHSLDSATRSGYFFDPAFDFYPVVNIDWESASRYCEWADKRLPTIDEWEVAASVAPATARHYVYPWGDVFQRQYANSQLTGVGDTQRVGLYHPLGSSSFGGADMAGNVAEWTTFATGGVAPLDENAVPEDVPAYVVKGGSYREDYLALRTDTYVEVDAHASYPWLGFRCVGTVSSESRQK